jgi:glycogen synthase
VFRSVPAAWGGLVSTGMKTDFTWDRSAALFAELFAEVSGKGTGPA